MLRARRLNGMNHWCARAVFLICAAGLTGGCSSDPPNGPSGQAGQSGASASGGGPSGASGQAGSNHAGSGQTAGSAGAATNSAGTAGSSEGGSAGEAPSGPYRAVTGKLCPIETTIGVVELRSGPPLSVQVTLYDQPDPWIAKTELSNPTCEFHRYNPGACSACDLGVVCSLGGACLPERRTIKNANLQVSTGTEQRQYSADPTLGGIYSMLDIGDASSSYAMTLSWNDTQITLDAMPVANGKLDELAVDTESTVNNLPGALDATWQPPGDATFVRTRIPINHHAGGPTFTECAAPTDAGTFHADADMINPLAVQTGLEFQGIDHVFIAAARTPQGCVEFRFGKRISVIVNDLDL
jgi:hypothetical protein